MTNKEQVEIDKLTKLISNFIDTSKTLHATNEDRITKIEQKVDKKHTPVYLEQEILRAAQHAIGEAVKSVLTGYSSPLVKLVESVVGEQSTFLREIISSSFNQVIQTQEFKNSIVSAFSHKVARSIISNNDGLFDKVSNELKQDAVFKSKMALAVSNVVEECLQKKN